MPLRYCMWTGKINNYWLYNGHCNCQGSANTKTSKWEKLIIYIWIWIVFLYFRIGVLYKKNSLLYSFSKTQCKKGPMTGQGFGWPCRNSIFLLFSQRAELKKNPFPHQRIEFSEEICCIVLLFSTVLSSLAAARSRAVKAQRSWATAFHWMPWLIKQKFSSRPLLLGSFRKLNRKSSGTATDS